MKRNISSEFNLKSLISFDEIYGALKNVTRFELYAIIKESGRLYSEKCAEVALSVPKEVWHIIFSLTISLDASSFSDNSVTVVFPKFESSFSWFCQHDRRVYS